MPFKWPSKSQWGQFFKILNKRERIIFSSLFVLALASFITLLIALYLDYTKVTPAFGGEYIEGVVGAPRYINPVYAMVSDVDRDLTELIYSGLMKYDKDGKIVSDLAEEPKVSDDGLVYEFYLKENLFWSDGKPITADDVVFTIKTIQNPSFKSPLRADWLGVKVDKISDLGIRFELKNPSAVFLENCTLKILPEHIWGEISYQNFPLSIYNLKPVGSGPYQLEKINQDKNNKITSIELVSNPKYYNRSPYIPEIKFSFFDTEEQLISAANKKEIKGFSLNSESSAQNLKNEQSKIFTDYHLTIPRYYAVFLNPDNSKALSYLEVRQALNYATNKEEIVNQLSVSKETIINSPLLPKVYGFNDPDKIYDFNPDTAKQILDQAGFILNDNGLREKIIKKQPAFQFKSVLKVGSQGTEVEELQKCLANSPAGGQDIYPDGTINGTFGAKTKQAVINFQEKYRSEILDPQNLTSGNGIVDKKTQDKLNSLCSAPDQETVPLSLSLVTVNQKPLTDIASIIKKQWEAIGASVDIKTFEVSSLEEEVIKPRNYDALLFGEILGTIPDPFPFWHSSQIKDPGLNLAGYQNKDCDKLLEDSRQTMDENQRRDLLERFQNILVNDAPAVFLYSPDYSYFVSKNIKGVDTILIAEPSKRFSNVENWYIKTKRVW